MLCVLLLLCCCCRCRERASNAKHVQVVSGAQPLLFWLANALWDALQYVASVAGIIVLIATYHLPQYSGQRLAAVTGLFAALGAAGVSLTYLMEGLFTVSGPLLVTACAPVVVLASHHLMHHDETSAQWQTINILQHPCTCVTAVSAPFSHISVSDTHAAVCCGPLPCVCTCAG
jgi:hypothetical protein